MSDTNSLRKQPSQVAIYDGATGKRVSVDVDALSDGFGGKKKKSKSPVALGPDNRGPDPQGIRAPDSTGRGGQGVAAVPIEGLAFPAQHFPPPSIRGIEDFEPPRTKRGNKSTTSVSSSARGTSTSSMNSPVRLGSSTDKVRDAAKGALGPIPKLKHVPGSSIKPRKPQTAFGRWTTYQ